MGYYIRQVAWLRKRRFLEEEWSKEEKDSMRKNLLGVEGLRRIHMKEGEEGNDELEGGPEM